MLLIKKQTGGPSVQIPTGRRDGRFSSISNVRSNIIDTSFTMDQMIKIFASKGLSLNDLVTLSGIIFSSLLVLKYQVVYCNCFMQIPYSLSFFVQIDKFCSKKQK